jgi:hypothetical protein
MGPLQANRTNYDAGHILCKAEFKLGKIQDS